MKGQHLTFLEKTREIEVLQNVELCEHTTMGVGGAATFMARVQNEIELERVLTAAKHCELPIFMMGGGSNLLISDSGLDAVVIKLKGQLAQIQSNAEKNGISVGAGASFPKLTSAALKLGWETALGWCGTPGQVGGALKMNAGSRLGEVGQTVQFVRGMTASGMISLNHDEIGFQYRTSAFPSDMILTQAQLFFSNDFMKNSDELAERARELAIKRKHSQPKLPSAGSVFKNPKGDFAGRLIEACGLKGKQSGNAMISPVHANFIVNCGNASASDIFSLSSVIQEEVQRKFDIKLEYEVKLIGKFGCIKP